MHYWYGAYRVLRGKTHTLVSGAISGFVLGCGVVCVSRIDFTAEKVIYQNYSRRLDTPCINNKAVRPSFNSVDLLSLPVRQHIHSLIDRQASLSDFSPHLSHRSHGFVSTLLLWGEKRVWSCARWLKAVQERRHTVPAVCSPPRKLNIEQQNQWKK